MKKFSTLLLVVTALACNTHEEYMADVIHSPFHLGRGGRDLPLISNSAPLTLLPQDQGDESPACLDGSPYGFYFVPSTTGSTKWTISIEGGGWCYNESLCYQRSQSELGSSKNWSKTGGCGCMNVIGDSIDENCNCIYMPYGDGASFSGYRPKPWPVGPNDQFLYFRGIKNFDGTIDAAMKLGLNKATEFVLTGGSAGGLSTFLHMDRVAARIKAVAPDCKIRGAPVVGYFLDHDNFAHSANNYTAWMKYIYTMQNLTFGSDGGLTAACQKAFPTDPHYCFMSPHMQQFIETPFFVFNSKYDAWQLANELQTNWATKPEQDAVLQYGVDFLNQFKPIQSEPKNGALITSCICHGCPWSDLVLEGKNTYQHYASWFVGNTSGASAIHIDPRLPNGNGTIVNSECAKFP